VTLGPAGGLAVCVVEVCVVEVCVVEVCVVEVVLPLVEEGPLLVDDVEVVVVEGGPKTRTYEAMLVAA